MKIKLLCLLLSAWISLLGVTRLYVNEYLANTNNLQDTKSKVEQWFNDNIRPGRFIGTSRMKGLQDSISVRQINEIIDSLRNKSFEDLAHFHKELKYRVSKQAKELAENHLRTELSLSLNDRCFNQLTFDERSDLVQKVEANISSEKLQVLSAYDLLKQNSPDVLKKRLATSAYNNYGKVCSSWYSTAPSAPPYSCKEQQDEQMGKKLAQDLKYCKLDPHCWAVVAAANQTENLFL